MSVMNDHLPVISGAQKKDDLLPLYFYEFTPKLKQQAKDELHEDEDTMQSSLDELRDLIRSGKFMNFPTDDRDLLPFLRVRKYDVQRAYITYKKYFSQFAAHDELYKNFDFESVLNVIKNNVFSTMLKRGAEGSLIAVMLLKNWNLSEVQPADILKTVVVSLMDVLYCPISQIAGTNLIVDCSNVTLRHLLSFRPRHVKFLSDCIQSTSPFRFKETHFLNHGQIMYSFWCLLKPLLSQKYVKRVHFHGNDIKSLHRFIQPSVLPEELGGTLGPLDNTPYIECLLKSKDIITKNIETFRMKMCD